MYSPPTCNRTYIPLQPQHHQSLKERAAQCKVNLAGYTPRREFSLKSQQPDCFTNRLTAALADALRCGKPRVSRALLSEDRSLMRQQASSFLDCAACTGFDGARTITGCTAAHPVGLSDL